VVGDPVEASTKISPLLSGLSGLVLILNGITLAEIDKIVFEFRKSLGEIPILCLNNNALDPFAGDGGRLRRLPHLMLYKSLSLFQLNSSMHHYGGYGISNLLSGVSIGNFFLGGPMSQELSQSLKEFNSSVGNNVQRFIFPVEVAFKGTSYYVGNDRCGSCHSLQYAAWSRSAHGKAYSKLFSVGRNQDSQCLGCHTVGFGSTSGFSLSAPLDSLKNVGCESCHGPGSVHYYAMQKKEKINSLYVQKSPAFAVCGGCHTEQKSRKFLPFFDHYVSRILCPK